MLAKMDANQARMKVMQEKMDAYQAKTDADREADRVKLQEVMKATQEDIRCSQAEMISVIGAIEEKMDAWIANRKNDRKETTACHNEMKARIKKMKPNSEEKETAVERQKIPNEEVAVHSLRACRSETATF
jgi:hypothetical protein